MCINSEPKVIGLPYILFEADRTGNKVDHPFRGARSIFIKTMKITTISSARYNLISHKLRTKLTRFGFPSVTGSTRFALGTGIFNFSPHQ